VCRQLDDAGITTAHVAGNSFGGWVALELARRGRARSVIALSPAGAWRHPRDIDRLDRSFKLAALLSSTRAVRRLAGFGRGRRILFRSLAEHSERLSLAEVDEMFEDMAGCVVVADLFGAIRRTGPVAPFATLDCPVRIAWGEKDRVLPFPRYGIPMLQAVPGADFLMLPGVGHVPMHDDPELIARTIVEFSARADGGDGDVARRLWPRQGRAQSVPRPDFTHEGVQMTEQFKCEGTRGTVVVRRWAASAPRYTVLLVHGYGEHSGRYAHVAERLVADGADVVAPDLAGHGLSDGERVLVEDVDELVADLRNVAERVRVAGRPVVVLGHSMGGIVATRYVQRHSDDVAALVLTGPIVGGNPGFEALAGMDPIPEVPIDTAALSRDPAVGEAYAADPLVWHGPFKRSTLQAMVAAVSAIAASPGFGALPTLWLHGELDQLAPLEVTRSAMEHLRGERLEEKVYPGAQHEILNETNKDEVVDDVLGFLHGVL